MNNKIAFTSDQHYLHNNIIRICDRPFDNITDHNKTLIANHNSVAVDDSWEMWLLGDTSYRGSAYETVKILEQLNGRLHILFGNHDKSLRQAWDRGMLDKMIKSGKIEIIGTKDRTEIVAKMLKIDNKVLILSHYAYRTWPTAFRGAIHLYGHSHNNLQPLYRSFDVGVDAQEFHPITIEQVILRAGAIGTDFSEK